MTEDRGESYDQVLTALRSRYLALRNHIERAVKGEFKRPDTWFEEQNRSLRMVRRAGEEFAFIAVYAAEYDAWKASLPPIVHTSEAAE